MNISGANKATNGSSDIGQGGHLAVDARTYDRTSSGRWRADAEEEEGESADLDDRSDVSPSDAPLSEAEMAQTRKMAHIASARNSDRLREWRRRNSAIGSSSDNCKAELSMSGGGRRILSPVERSAHICVAAVQRGEAQKEEQGCPYDDDEMKIKSTARRGPAMYSQESDAGETIPRNSEIGGQPYLDGLDRKILEKMSGCGSQDGTNSERNVLVKMSTGDTAELDRQILEKMSGGGRQDSANLDKKILGMLSGGGKQDSSELDRQNVGQMSSGSSDQRGGGGFFNRGRGQRRRKRRRGPNPGPGAYYVHGRAFGQIPAWAMRQFRAGSSLFTSSTPDDRTDLSVMNASVCVRRPDEFTDETEESEKTSILMIPSVRRGLMFLSVTLVAGMAVGLAVGLTVSGKNSEAGDKKIQTDQTDVVDEPKDIDKLTPLCSAVGVVSDPGREVIRSSGYLEFMRMLSPSVSSADAFEDACSPHSMALQFLSDEDSLKLKADIFVFHRIVQRYVVTLFYYSTTSNGDLISSDKWLSGVSECNWAHLKCSKEGFVTEISSVNNNIDGTLPMELAELKRLTSLSLSQNGLEGTIPTAFGKLSRLVKLDLSVNNLHGPIPESIQKLSSLTYLNIGYNELSGDIPAGLYSLSNLEYFGLGKNKLTGTVSSAFGSSLHLETIELQYNRFKGTFPGDVSRLSMLKYLDIAGNSFEGNIPAKVGSMSSLVKCPECELTLEL